MVENSTVPYALVVDDHPMILLHATDILEDAGFRTLTAYNSDEAIKRLSSAGGGTMSCCFYRR